MQYNAGNDRARAHKNRNAHEAEAYGTEHLEDSLKAILRFPLKKLANADCKGKTYTITAVIGLFDQSFEKKSAEKHFFY